MSFTPEDISNFKEAIREILETKYQHIIDELQQKYSELEQRNKVLQGIIESRSEQSDTCSKCKKVNGLLTAVDSLLESATQYDLNDLDQQRTEDTSSRAVDQLESLDSGSMMVESSDESRRSSPIDEKPIISSVEKVSDTTQCDTQKNLKTTVLPRAGEPCPPQTNGIVNQKAQSSLPEIETITIDSD